MATDAAATDATPADPGLADAALADEALADEALADEALADAARTQRARVVASVARRTGDLALAEDAAQEALARAAVAWPRQGVPERPGAWLTTVAQRVAVDALRRQRPSQPLPEDLPDGGPRDPDGREDRPDDDLLALVLACCHPALSPEARIALTLRHVCGLADAQIAAGLLISPSTLTKRLVRARRKVRDTRLVLGVPDAADLDDRIDGVRQIAYLLATEGHMPSAEGPAVRIDLLAEARWLTAELDRLRPDDEETIGLLALLTLLHARTGHRTTGGGALRPLDRRRRRPTWDPRAVEEARTLLARTGRRVLGPYQVQAAIALLHTADDGPDWAAIADLHGLLARLQPSPVVEVNRALAVARADDAAAGLAVLQPVIDGGRLDGYAPLHAVHAEIREALGQADAARRAWQRAAEVAATDAQRAVLRGRAAQLGG